MFSQTVTLAEKELYEDELNRFSSLSEELPSEYNEIIARTVCASHSLIDTLYRERMPRYAEFGDFFKKRNQDVLEYITFMRSLAKELADIKTTHEQRIYLTKQIELIQESMRLMQCVIAQDVNAAFLQDLSAYSIDIVNAFYEEEARAQSANEKTSIIEKEKASLIKTSNSALVLHSALFAIGFISLLIVFPSIIIPIYIILGMALILTTQHLLAKNVFKKRDEIEKVRDEDRFYRANNATFFANKSVGVIRTSLRQHNQLQMLK